MTSSDYAIVVSGNDYDEQIRICDEFGTVLFDGLSDDLVTSVRGPLQLRLNFGDVDTEASYTIYQCGADALLLPEIDSTIGRFPAILRWAAIEDLWHQLRYPLEELHTVPGASTYDLLWAWVLGLQHLSQAGDSLADRASAIRRQIVAEEALGSPAIVDWLGAVLEDSVEVSGPVLRKSPEVQMVTAYLDSSRGLLEWPALVAADRSLLQIGGRWLVRARRR